MKKHVLFLAILITALCATAYASSSDYWDDGNDDGGTDSQGGGELAVPASIESLTVLFLKGDTFPGIKSDFFIVDGETTFPDETTYLTTKIFDITTGTAVPLLHSPKMYNSETVSLCDNLYQEDVEDSKKACDNATKKLGDFCSHVDLFQQDKDYQNWTDTYCNSDGSVDYTRVKTYNAGGGMCKPYKSTNYQICGGSVSEHGKGLADNYVIWCEQKVVKYSGSQKFSCNLSTQTNTSLTVDSKISLEFYNGDQLLAKTLEPIELKNTQDAKIALQSALEVVLAGIVAASNGREFVPPQTTLDSIDTDNDTIKDADDNFPTVSNTDQKSPVKLTPSIAQVDTTLDSGGCDCNLNPAATANGLGWLVDILILGMPAALFGFRRK